VSLLVLAGIAGGIALAGAVAVSVRWVARREGGERSAPRALSDGLPDVPKASPVSSPTSPADAPNQDAPCFASFGLALGDVVMLRDSEAWLTGALRLRDGGEEEAVLFFTDQTTEGDVLIVRPGPRRKLFLVKGIEMPGGGFAPHCVEHERELFNRTRWIPVTLERHGEGCPDLGEGATFAWFESAAGEVLACLFGPSIALGWRGEELAEGSALRLAAGSATFRE
jgi:hypothetical protein